MRGDIPTGLAETDLVHLRRAFALADAARASGERPFGAVIADARGVVASEAICAPIAQCDPTAHAEVSAIRALWSSTGGKPLDGATLYSSTEPCAMCAGAIYWAKITRVVFGLAETRLRAFRNVAAHTAALTIGCRAVLESGSHATTIIGPVLEDEALRVHQDFWTAQTR